MNTPWVNFVSIAVILAVSGHAQAPSDFDGDGISDLTAVIASGNSLTWQAKRSSDGVAVSLGSLGTLGNHVALGPWRSDRSEPAVIDDDGQNEVRWRIASGRSFRLGSRTATMVSGADFDGNGLADAAAVRLSGSALEWKILLNAGTATPTATTRSFGRKGNSIAFARRTAGVDAMLITRAEARGLGVIWRTLSGQTNRIVLARQSGTVIPVRGPNGADSLLLVKKSGSTYTLNAFTESGRLFRRSLRFRGKELLIGDYLVAAPGFELAFVDGSRATVINLFNGARRATSMPSGIAVDQININSFGTSSTPGDCSTGDPTDGNGGFVWKPNSDTQFYAVAVLPSRFNGKVRSVESQTTSGAKIKELFYKGCANPDPLPRCNYQDRAMTGGEYRRQHGSIRLVVYQNDGQCVVFPLADPSRRID